MALIKCSECAAEISDKASCCPKCGAPVVVHKWRCSECGNMISEETCPYCGARVHGYKEATNISGDIYIGNYNTANRRNENIYSNGRSYSDGAGHSIKSGGGDSASTSSETPEFVTKHKRQIIVATVSWIIVVVIFIGLLIVGISSSGGSNNTGVNSHNNCMFIGYADPNRPLNGSTIISREPKYGYRPVYVDRDDIYNTYHFH